MGNINPKTWVEAIVELIWRVGLRFALWGGLLYILYRVRSIIVFIILAAVLTYAVTPTVDFLCRRKINWLNIKHQRMVATLLVFVVIGFITGSVVAEFAKPFAKELGDLTANSSSYAKQLESLAKNAGKWYQALPDDARKFIEQQNFEGFVDGFAKWTAQVGKETVNNLRHIMEFILIPVLAFYFTLDSRPLKREFVAVLPKRKRKEALGLIHELNCIMRSYVIGQIILCVIAGLAVAVIMHFAGMRYALIMSVFAGVTRAIPVVGPIISGIAIVLLGVIKSPILGLNLLILFAIIHFVESKFIMPKLIGDRMQLHPAIIIVVLLIGAEFFGIFGMFMAAPVAALVRVLVRYYLIKPKKLHVWGLAHPADGTLDEEATIPIEKT